MDFLKFAFIINTDQISIRGGIFRINVCNKLKLDNTRRCYINLERNGEI